MQGLLNRIMAGRVQAISSASLCALLSMLILPMGYVCGGIIGLATLRNGMTEGALVVAGALLLTGGVMWVSLHTPMPAVMMAAVTWLPVWLLCGVLQATTSLALTLTAAGGLVAAGLLVFRLLVGDPVAWWRETWRMLLGSGQSAPADPGPAGAGGTPAVSPGGIADPGASAAAGQAPEMAADLQSILDAAAPMMTGVAAVLTLLGLVIMVLLARWWHAILDNPGGFGREFRSLTLPGGLAVVTLLCLVAVIVLRDGARALALELLMIAVTLHVLHGLAVVHAVINRRRASTGWLVLVYLLLGLVPVPGVYVASLLALVGMSDRWVGYRERVKPRT